MFSFKSLLFLSFTLLLSATGVQASLWNEISSARRNLDAKPVLQRQFRVDKNALHRTLARADFADRQAATSTIELPLANGQIERFRLEKSPILAPELAARFPDIKTFRVSGLDNPALTGRLSLTANGFHGMLSTAQGTIYIDPQGNDRYRVYNHSQQSASEPFHCGVKGHTLTTPVTPRRARRSALRTPGSLRVYRLAVATTAEYTDAIRKSISTTEAAKKADVMAEIAVVINRVNEIYNRDLGIKLVLIANNDLLINTGGSSDYPYTNNDGSEMLGENQLNIDAVIGSSNYDIGHVFSTGGGGIAEVGAVCDSTPYTDNITGITYQGRKAGGVTGSSNPTGESFYIDYVAHEIGHQFSGEHTFNGTEQSCGGGNRWAASAFEPGSGSTIMSYAGICGQENIALNAIAMFHAGSIELIDDFTSSGAGASCGTNEAIANSAEPSVDGGSDYTIPAQTPFMLSANAQDNDGDALIYSWDQMDAGTATDSATFGQDLGDNSLFRSYLPRAENWRHFPALGTTLLNLYDESEVMACTTRDLSFRVTVLDGNSGIGQDDVKISVISTAGPFEITSHTSSQSLAPGATSVSWNVANTDQAPVNCNSVDISLLTFNADKSRYIETVLADGLANNGSAQVELPDHASSIARFKIQCSNNVFYDISDADLTITGSTAFSGNEKVVYSNADGKFLTLSLTPPACDLSNSGGDSGSTSSGSSGSSTPKSGSASGSWSIIDLLGMAAMLLLVSAQRLRHQRLKAYNAA